MEPLRVCGGGGQLGCKAAKEWICGVWAACQRGDEVGAVSRLLRGFNTDQQSSDTSLSLLLWPVA